MAELPSIETKFVSAFADNNGLDEINDSWNTLLDIVFPSAFANANERDAWFALWGSKVQYLAETSISGVTADFTSNNTLALSLMTAIRVAINDRDNTNLAAIQNIAFDSVNVGKGASANATFSNWLSILTTLVSEYQFKNRK